MRKTSVERKSDRRTTLKLSPSPTDKRAAVQAMRQSSARPSIVINQTSLLNMTNEVLQVLIDSNELLYEHDDALVTIRKKSNGAAVIRKLTVPGLRRIVAKHIDFLTAVGDEDNVRAAIPPSALIQNVLETHPLPFPRLVTVTQVPIVQPNGGIITKPGFDHETHLYYCPTGDIANLTIPEKPEAAQVDRAVKLIHLVFGEFPFVDEASRANAIGFLVTLIARPILSGCVPLAVVVAPMQGTGKTFLPMLCALITTGRFAAAAIPKRNAEEEWRKAITAHFRRADELVVLDNFPPRARLDSPNLAAALTSEYWEDRVLGASNIVRLSTRKTWAVTGNNVQVAGDLIRRHYRIRLDAQIDRPWTRQFEQDIEQMVRDRRAEFLAAVLTIIRAWSIANCAKAEVPRLNGFQNWADTIGAILSFAGIHGFLGNLAESQAEVTREGDEFTELLQFAFDRFGGSSFTIRKLCAELSKVEKWQVVVPQSIRAGAESPKDMRQTLGIEVASLMGRRHGGFNVCDAGINGHEKVRQFRLERVQ